MLCAQTYLKRSTGTLALLNYDGGLLFVVSSLAIVLKLPQLAICGMSASAEVVVEAVPGVS